MKIEDYKKIQKSVRAKPRHLEDNLQENCVRWLRLNYKNVLIFAIPNGGRRNIREAARLKRQGVTKGIPDLFIAHPMEKSCGLFIELKIGKNKMTPEQKEIQDHLWIRGYSHFCCWTFEDFITVVSNYLEIGK